jgi:hypothetical protein
MRNAAEYSNPSQLLPRYLAKRDSHDDANFKYNDWSKIAKKEEVQNTPAGNPGYTTRMP